MANILKVLAKTPQFILLIKVVLQSFIACNLSLLHFGNPIFETTDKVFQLSFGSCFIGKFLGPFLVLIVNVDVIGIQLTFQTVLLG